MDPGRLDRRATFLRRPILRDDAGDETGRGPYAPVFSLWASFRPESAREAAEGGRAQNVESGILTVRDSTKARTVTNGDRVTVQDRDFNIAGVGLPDRRTGLIALSVSSNLGGE